MKKILVLVAFAISLGCVAQTNITEVWVSPSGTDVSNVTGSKETPFATLEQALLYVRQLRQQKSPEELGEVHIVLRGGVYKLGHTLCLEAADAGTLLSPTIIEAAQGESPVLSGGVDVGGWQNAGDVTGLPEVAQGHVWQVPTPVVDGKPVEFRQMWVNGVKMRRASTFDDMSMPQIISVDKNAKTLTVPRPLMDLSKAKHLELNIPQDWVVNVMRVTGIKHKDDFSSVLSFESKEADIEFKRPYPILRADYGSHSNHRFFFSNAIELLNRPQEWYNDKDGSTLYYWPRNGETHDGVEAVVPRLETLVNISGSLDNLVSDIHFRGITFEHTTWMRPSTDGHVELQAGQYLFDAWSENTATANNVAWVGRPAAGVSVQNARNVSFEGCHFRHMGSTALDFVSGTRHMTVNGCVFSDIAGSGVSGGFFGDETFEVHQAYNPEDMRVVCDSIYVTNNYMVQVANEDWGCVGVGIGYASNVNILHNEIVGAPYSAISVGWGWISTKNIMHDNHINYNHINGFAVHLRDCGAIYTLSPQPNSSIIGNCIEKPGDPEHCPLMWDMKTAQFDIYTDEGTDYYKVTDNWCLGNFSMNKNGSHNTWTNNGMNVSDAIREKAGLEEAYKEISHKVAVATYAPVDSIGDRVNANRDQIDYISQNDGFKLGDAVAVDLNNDNLCDIVYSGGEGNQTRVGGVRINTGNYGFVATQAITNANMCSLAAGDLNGDGHIDVVQAGFDFWDAYNAVLMNDGSGRLIAEALSDGASIAPACGIADINNDALPDYFFVGNGSRNAFYMQKASRDGYDKKTKLTLPGGFNEPNIMYADFDNSQSVDICLLSDKSGGVYTRIHYNEGTGVFTEKSVGFKEKGTRGGMAYADVNGDGWLDVAIGGELVGEIWSTTAAEGGKTVSLYLNKGDGTFTLAQEFSEYMQDNVSHPIRFCDWNNDGHSDLILAGWNMSQGNIAQVDVYLNDGAGKFTKSNVDLPGVSESSLELADFTGEGRNDILISGNANGALGFHGYNVDRRLAVLCKNKTERANTSPLPPTELSAEVDGNSVVLNWNSGSDAETPVKSLSYNYYLRNLDTGQYLMFPNSDIATGVRRVTSMGNAWLNLGWTLNRLPRGNYAWSVQSVDAGYAGSAFAAEQTFTITDELTEEEEEVETSVDKKLLEAGWTLVETFSGVDCADNYFAFLDAETGMTVIAQNAVGDKNWGNTYAMYYANGVDPNTSISGVFGLDAFDVTSDMKVIITPLSDPNRHFRTEGWNHTLWQTYSDVHKEGDSYGVDGNRNIAMVYPELFRDRGWALKNKTTNAYLGPWVSGAFEDGAEFAADKRDANVTYFDIYTIPRVQYLQQLNDWSSATYDNPLEITQLITNPSFGRYDESRHPIGWIVEGEGMVEQQGYLPGCEYYAYMNNWQNSGKLSNRSVSQTVKNLPKGKYRLTVYSLCPAEGAFLFANDQNVDLKHEGNADVSLDFVMPEDGDAVIGVRLQNYQSNNFKFDNIRLYYVGPCDDEEVSVDNVVRSPKTENAIYDLQGRKQQDKRRGINIVDGTKVLVR